MKKDTALVANELIKQLDTHLDDENIGNPFFPERGVRPFPLTTDGFKVIERVDSHNACDDRSIQSSNFAASPFCLRATKLFSSD